MFEAPKYYIYQALEYHLGSCANRSMKEAPSKILVREYMLSGGEKNGFQAWEFCNIIVYPDDYDNTARKSRSFLYYTRIRVTAVL
jgi:hypothetical protein